MERINKVVNFTWVSDHSWYQLWLFLSSKAILYFFPFSVSLVCLLASPSINRTTPILYTSSWMAPTISMILSWPSLKKSALFAPASGGCTCPLELPSWYLLLCPSVSSLILKFSKLIRRLWSSLDTPFNNISIPVWFSICRHLVRNSSLRLIYCKYNCLSQWLYTGRIFLIMLYFQRQEIAIIGKYRLSLI